MTERNKIVIEYLVNQILEDVNSEHFTNESVLTSIEKEASEDQQEYKRYYINVRKDNLEVYDRIRDRLYEIKALINQTEEEDEYN